MFDPDAHMPPPPEPVYFEEKEEKCVEKWSKLTRQPRPSG
jgi:hypothetical protein